MEELFNQFVGEEQSFSVTNYLINILICCALLYTLSLIYVRYGKSISNRHQLSRVLIIVGVTTFLIISIVKSSLALSLGLVGALSIIRFRTAIKEPEELGYFFISIAVGLGLGANQLFPTILGFVVICLFIVLLNKNGLKSMQQNLLISLDYEGKDSDQILEEITKIVGENSNQIELKRFKNQGSTLDLNFLINVSSLNEIATINRQLLDISSTKAEITFIDNQL